MKQFMARMRVGAVIALVVTVTLPVVLVAQQTAASMFVVRGVVYDSVAGHPLVGATVQIASTQSLYAPRTATADSLGRYRFDGLQAGQYTVGFFDEALTSLGLDAVTRSITLGAESVIIVDLAIPSSAAVRSIRCGDIPPYAPGMLVGSVRDAENRSAMPGAKIAVQWGALALDAGNYRTVKERVLATIEEDGSFLACNLPLDAPLDLDVWAPGHRSVEGPVVSVPPNGIARLDLLLADSALTTGSAMIRGRVTRENGKPVTSGRVAIKALGRDVPVQDGAFVVANVPAGTWVAESRVIGVEPREVIVTASDSAVASATITVSNHAQRLDVVTVMGKPDRNTQLLDEVLRRSRVGTGTTFLPGSPALMSATFTSDVMREARGFQYHGPNSIEGRPDKGRPCFRVAVYVDNVRQPDAFDGIDNVAPVRDVLAIETWADLDFAPIQYRVRKMASGLAPRTGPALPPSPTPIPCALVLIWTRRGF